MSALLRRHFLLVIISFLSLLLVMAQRQACADGISELPEQPFTGQLDISQVRGGENPSKNSELFGTRSGDRGEDHLEKPPKKRVGIAAFPFIAYQPETSLVFGGISTLTFRDKHRIDEDRPDNITLMMVYTMKNQFVININPDFYFDSYNWELKINTAYQKFPDTFFGVGNDNSEDRDWADGVCNHPQLPHAGSRSSA